MISKFKIRNDILICIKCEQFNHKLLTLPCHHFVCHDCINSQKVKIVYHCKKWKLFLSQEIDPKLCFKISNKIYQRFIRSRQDCWLSKLELSFILYLNSIDENVDFIAKNFKCNICNNISGNLNINYYGNLICNDCGQSSNVNLNSENSEIKQTVSDIFDFGIKISNKKIDYIIRDLELFFDQFDSKRYQAIFFIYNEKFIGNFYYDEEKTILDINLAINKSRYNLIQELELKKQAFRKSLLNECKMIKFKEYKTTLLSFQIFGYFKNIVPIFKRVKFVHFYPKFLTFKNLIHSEKIIVNWTPLNRISDFFSPIYLARFFLIYFSSFNEEISYETVIQNPIIDKSFKQFQFGDKEKLEYFRIDYKLNRIGFLFEIKYEIKYVIKVYDLYGSKLLCSKVFDFYIENFLFDSKLIVIWNSNLRNCLSFYDENFQILEKKIEINGDVNNAFYYLADCDDEYLYLNNQNQIGKLCKKSGKLAQIFNLIEMENFSDGEIMRPLHVPSEYLNIKIYQEFMVVCTYSSVYVFDKNNFKILSKNKIFNIKNNDWSIPNKVYFTKDGYLAFYDKNNITFI